MTRDVRSEGRRSGPATAAAVVRPKSARSHRRPGRRAAMARHPGIGRGRSAAGPRPSSTMRRPLAEPADVLAAIARMLARRRRRGDPRWLPDQAGRHRRSGVQTWVNEYPTFGRARCRGSSWVAAATTRRGSRQAARSRHPGRHLRAGGRRSTSWRSTCSGSTAMAARRPAARAQAACSSRSCAEPELVRAGPFVRPPIGTWIGSWRAPGFQGPHLQGRELALPTRARPPRTGAASRMPRR